MPSITRLSILEGASDITHVSCFLISKVLGVFSIDPSMWARQRGTGVKVTCSVSPILIFCCKASRRILSNKSCSIFTSIILFLLVNLKLMRFYSGNFIPFGFRSLETSYLVKFSPSNRYDIILNFA